MFNYKSKVTELRESVKLTRNVSVIFFLSALGIFFSAASPILSFPQEEAVLFADVVNVSKNSSTFPINHKVAVSGNNIFVIWADVPLGTNSSINSNNSNSDFNLQEEIYFTKSVDGGNNFGPIVNLSNKNGSSNIPYIASSENHVYAIWQDDSGIEGNQKIYLTKSVDVGNSFGPVMNLSNGTGSSSNPQIVASEQDVYVVWQADNSAGQENQEIYFIKSVDGGNSFGPVMNLSNTNDGDSRDPKISILRSGSGEREEEKNNNGTSLYFVWTECISEEDEPSCDIFFTKSVDGGNSFGPVMNLSNGTGSSFNPQIDVSSAPKPNRQQYCLCCMAG